MTKIPLIQRLVVGASMVAGLCAATVSSAGAAVLTTQTVDAITPIGSWLDTGVDLSAGSIYELWVVNPNTIWSAGAETPFSRDSNANGINPAYYGTWTMDGFTANYGALVGEVGPTPGGGAGDSFFLIGTGTPVTGLAGELYVGYWDSNYGDNSGIQTLQISSVPEPASWALMLAGVFAIGAGLRTRRSAPSAA